MGDLPEGDCGIRAPKGGINIASEHSYSVLSDGTFYCVYRTIDGYPGCCFSRDGGKSWSDPTFKKYGDGRLIKHPRAANFVWKCSNGKFLYWFHNHGGDFIGRIRIEGVMLILIEIPFGCPAGIEVDTDEGKCIGSQPEIVLMMMTLT